MNPLLAAQDASGFLLSWVFFGVVQSRFERGKKFWSAPGRRIHRRTPRMAAAEHKLLRAHYGGWSASAAWARADSVWTSSPKPLIFQLDDSQSALSGAVHTLLLHRHNVLPAGPMTARAPSPFAFPRQCNLLQRCRAANNPNNAALPPRHNADGAESTTDN